MKKTTAFLVGIILLLQTVAPAQALALSADVDTVVGLKNNTYLSPVKKAPIRFTGLGMKWHQVKPEGTSAKVDVRFMEDGKWTEWYDIENESNTDDSDPAMELDYNPSAFIATNETDTFQYKVSLSSELPDITPVIENFEFTYINSAGKIVGSVETISASIPEDTLVRLLGVTATENLLVKRTTASSGPKIIARSEWGADEGLRLWQEDRPPEQLVTLPSDYYVKYADEMKIVRKVELTDDGKKLTWPLDYPEKVRKIIIHHTATTKDLNDPEKAIRDIYYYHAISKGWGDIGYNYIIDQKGNIYEGRYGGDGVVGAHAGGGNVGSIGIAVLGNYQSTDVPQKALDALESLIKVKIDKYGIDPTGTSVFRGVNSQNIMGHRDIMATTCPGDKFFALLPSIRSKLKGTYKPRVVDKRRVAEAKAQYDFSLSNSPSAKLNPGETKSITIKLKNIGTAEWGAETYLIVSKDDNSNRLLTSGQTIRSVNLGKKIKSGATATFKIDFPAGYWGGMGSVEVFPFINGKTKIEKYISVPTQVAAPDFSYTVSKIELEKSSLKIGEKTVAKVQLKNTGNVVWRRDGVNKILLGTEKPRDRVSQIMIRPGTRLGTLLEREVGPGKTGTFLVNIKAPAKEGLLREYFAPVIEGISWLKSKDSYLEFYVYNSLRLAMFIGSTGDTQLLPGTTGKIKVDYVNGGGAVWENKGKDALKFDVIPAANLSVKNMSVTQSSILPGQTASLNLSITAPKTEGFYKIEITPKLGDNKLTARPNYVYVKVSKSNTGNTSAKIGTLKNNITVSLGFRGTPQISANGVFRLLDSGNELGRFSKNEKVSVNYEQGKYMIKGDKQAFAIAKAPRFEPVDGSILRIDNYEHRPAWNTSYNDNEYRGALEVHRYENVLHVVNDVNIEDYLKGLAEISATDPYEKIKAVIVLARSYAYFYANLAEKFPGAPFNLSDDPERSQKYLGYGFEKRNTTGVKAVVDTKDRVVTYNGKLIKTPYFSSDDGRTRSAQEVWGWTDTPYLASVDDPGCKGMTMQGHGVGLSGCGSLYFANLGKKYDEIIKYYFKGVEIKKQNEL